MACPHDLLTTPFRLALAQDFADTGRVPEAIAVVDEAMQQVEVNDDACYRPELTDCLVCSGWFVAKIGQHK